MNLILKKVKLSENVHCYTFLAPEIVKKAKPGQFVIMRVEDGGERIPFTVCAKDAATGGLSILIQTVGAETRKLSYLNEGDFIAGLVGPLGKPTDLGNPKRVLLISGGIGASVLYHQSTALKADGIPTDLIAGARNKDLIIFENEFRENCDKAYIMTDDGSGGQKGLVTDKLRELLENGENYDVVFAVGPMRMMQAVAAATKPFGVKTLVSMNPIMIDGTGMCGCCRLSVGGITKYACVDGPEFDGHKVDFEEAISRSRVYFAQERESDCRLLKEKEGK